MRDKYKNSAHFIRWIDEFNDSNNTVSSWIISGKTPFERIDLMKQSMVQSYLNLIKCKYSLGAHPIMLSEDLKNAIQLTNESWKNSWLLYYRERYLKQYVLSAYDEMIGMLSLGYLLNIDENTFKKLIEVIDRDHVKDYLFEFIIRAKIKDRIPIASESYEYSWKLFGKLRQAIIEPDKLKAQLLVKEFITKDWYKEHKNAAWYNSHKSIHNTYFGYWSFETAAVVKIMGLDDSSFKDCIYYL